jgi:hypothetical protein
VVEKRDRRSERRERSESVRVREIRARTAERVVSGAHTRGWTPQALGHRNRNLRPSGARLHRADIHW